MTRLARRPATGPVMVAIGALGGVALVSVVDPGQPGHYPSCPVKALTGWSCPGCGSLRAVHALTHGDLAGAIGHNPLAVAVLPVLVWAYLAWVRRLVAGAPRRRISPPWVVHVTLATVLVFAVVRNLPAVTWLGR